MQCSRFYKDDDATYDLGDKDKFKIWVILMY